MKRKIKSTFFLCILFGVLYQCEWITNYWNSTHSVVIGAPLSDVYKFITNPDLVELWFEWIPHLQPADSRPLGINKQFRTVYKIPLIGEQSVLFKIIHFIPNRSIVLESDAHLKPHLEIQLLMERNRETRVKLQIGYRRYNLLFHIFVAPVLSYLTKNQLHHALFKLKSFF